MITSWSPSRLSKWEQCPRLAQYEYEMKLCPACFKGKMIGWDPQVCDSCAKEAETPAAMARGTEMHKEAEDFIKGRHKLPSRMANVGALLKQYRKDYQKGRLKIEEDLCFQAGWVPVSKYEKGAWLRTKLDVLSVEDDCAEVVDWKSGGIDKRTGEVKAADKYTDQLNIYAVAVLSALPQVNKVIAMLAFFDAVKNNVVTSGGLVERKDLPALQKKWEGRARGMLQDELFVPRPSMGCRWCSFSKAKGGPCAF